MSEARLIDKKELVKRHPALGAKPYRLAWMIRARLIPTVSVGGRIYFDESEIDKWVKKNRLAAENGGIK